MGNRMQTWTLVVDIVYKLGLLGGGMFGLHLAWKRVTATSKQADAQIVQAEMSRRVHVAELFNRAVAQLKDDKLEIRLGAIYTLRQICRDFSDLADPIADLLATYLRENRIDYGDDGPPVDIALISGILREQQEKIQ